MAKPLPAFLLSIILGIMAGSARSASVEEFY